MCAHGAPKQTLATLVESAPDMQVHHDVHSLSWIAGLVLVILIVRDIFNALMVPGRMKGHFGLCRCIFKRLGHCGQLWDAGSRTKKVERGC
jgi:hypothetical protein